MFGRCASPSICNTTKVKRNERWTKYLVRIFTGCDSMAWFDYFIVGICWQVRLLATADFKCNYDIDGYQYRRRIP
jgi:hypothetical protein